MSLSLWNRNSPFGFGGFDDEFFSGSPVFGVPATFKNDILLHSSPRYEVSENSKQFRLAIDVPGVKPDDIKVDLENDGRVLHMKGHRKVEKENSFEEYKFEKRFALGNDLDTTRITANLSDGVLILTAPKKEKEEPRATTVPITLGEAPALMDE